MRKPKGWNYRYELYYQDGEWHVTHAFGQNKGFGLTKTIRMSESVGTSNLLRRTDTNSVVVPVVIKWQAGHEIVFNQCWGAKSGPFPQGWTERPADQDDRIRAETERCRGLRAEERQ